MTNKVRVLSDSQNHVPTYEPQAVHRSTSKMAKMVVEHVVVTIKWFDVKRGYFFIT